MDFDKDINYSDELWARVEDNIITIGVRQDFMEDVNDLWGVDLPEEGDEVNPEKICGEVETDDGPINLYSPIEGAVIETNSTVKTDPSMLFDDSTSEGWLIKIESTDDEDLERFLAEHAEDEYEEED